MLSLQIGQCGNQLGYQLYSLANTDIEAGSSKTDNYVHDVYSKWFETSENSNKHIARAILVDTDNKIIDKIIRKNDTDTWCYKSKNIIKSDDGGGTGNNWAVGYLKKGPEFEESIFETIRAELECTDRLDGYLCLLGCAGGTGSGIGSHIIKSLRHEYPTKNIVGVLVFPFSYGEVPTQNYNTILSLEQIVDNTDMIVTLENDKLQQELRNKSLGLSSQHVEINYFDDLNNIACQKLLSAFQPATDINNDGKKSNKMNYMISKLIIHPAYKFTYIESNVINLNINNSERLSWRWQYKNFRRNLMFNYTDYSSDGTCKTSKSLANILITRGFTEWGGNNFSHKRNYDFMNYGELNKEDIYSSVKWISSDERFSHFHQTRQLFNYEKLATIISNNTQAQKLLNNTVNKSLTIYKHRAYLHQYRKFGLEDEDFLKAFSKVQEYIASYKQLENS